MPRDSKGLLPVQLDPESHGGLTPEEEAELEQARARLRSCIRRYLGDEDGAPQLKKQFRAATGKYLQAIGHAVTLVTGCGLERFSSKNTDPAELCRPEQRAGVEEWSKQPPRALTLAADQQSCGPSGASFLQAGQLSLLMDLVMDPPHRFWNSEKVGLMGCGAWETILLTQVPYSVSDGPWQSGGLFAELNSAREEYLRLNHWSTCPLYQSLLPHFAREAGRPRSWAAKPSQRRCGRCSPLTGIYSSRGLSQRCAGGFLGTIATSIGERYRPSGSWFSCCGGWVLVS